MATGSVVVGATLAATQAGDTVTSAGSVLIAASVAVTQVDQVFAAAGVVVIGGSLVVTQAADTLTAGDPPPPPPAPPGRPAGGWVVHDPGRKWTVYDPGTVWVLGAHPPALRKAAAASRVYTIDLTQQRDLRAGATLTGTPAVAPSPAPGGPTISGAVIAGKRIKFRATGGTPGEYKLTFSVGTSDGDTLADSVTLVVD